MTFDKRFYGIYLGNVVDSNDPEKLGRIRVQVPQVTGDAITDWVDVCNDGGGITTAKSIYGAFQDDTTQTIVANTSQAMRIGVVDAANGIKIVDGSKIKVDYPGTYNVQWSGQFQNTDTQLHDASIWLRKNGTDVPGSAGIISVPNTHGGVHGHTIASWNYVFNAEANDYYELWWSADDAKITLQYYPVGTSPTRPSTASLIVTITPVGNIVPLPGENVWIMYMAGDPNFPVWMGASK